MSDAPIKTPHQLYEQIEGVVKRMDDYTKLLEKAMDARLEAEVKWETVNDDFLEREHARGKMPAADVRAALSRQANRDEWNALHRAKRDVERAEKVLQVLRAQLSGVQSELSAQRAESFASMNAPDPLKWSGGRSR